MGRRDERIDEYIAKAAPFARPLLETMREIVHEAVPAVEETIKWRSPFFVYEGPLCNMAAFKAHCAFGFWKGNLVVGQPEADQKSAGHLGRLTSIDDLPPKKVLIAWIRKAAKLNEEGIRTPERGTKRAAKPEIAMPPEFESALARSGSGRKDFDALAPSHRREYIEWIAEARTEPTRERRIAQAIEWIQQGKSRNWKYARKS